MLVGRAVREDMKYRQARRFELGCQDDPAVAMLGVSLGAQQCHRTGLVESDDLGDCPPKRR